MKILFVFTGGTIGSSESGGVADVDPTTHRKIIDICKNRCEYDLAFPYNILSENSTCETLSQICNYMLSVDYRLYDGVIVTHGSDTLAYTANLLSIALSFVEIPIVITAADCVMSNPLSNAEANLIKSLDFIETKTAGVFVSWKNFDGQPSIYSASKLLEADGNDNFSQWSGDGFPLCRDMAFLKNQKINIQNNVVLLKSYVGLDYSIFDLSKKSAVLLELYHSSTACFEGENNSFLTLRNICEKNNVDLYVCHVKKRDYVYSSSLALNNTRKFKNISVITAYSALLLAYSLDQNNRHIILDKLIY